MPIVPTFGREDLPQIQSTGPQANPAAAAVVGDSLQRLGLSGVGLSDAGLDYLHRHVQQENYDYTATNIADGRTKWTDQKLKRYDAARQSGNYDDLASGLTADMQADLQQRLKTAPSQRAADALTKMWSSLQGEVTTQASVVAGDGKRSVWTNNYDTNLGQFRTAAMRDPAEADNIFAEAQGVIKGGIAAGLGQGDIARVTERTKNEVYGAAAQGELLNNPAGLLGKLKSGYYDSRLSEPQLFEFGNQADARIKAQQAEATRQANENALMMRGGIENDFRDNLASISDTGKPAVPLTRAQIAAAYPREPQRVDAMMNAIDEAQKGYLARTSVSLQSPQDDAALLLKLKPSGPGYEDQAGVYNAALKAIQDKQKALTTGDAAAYVQQNAPQVRALFQAAAKDPSVLPKAIAAQDAVYDTLRVPMDQRSVLSEPDAAGVVAKLTSVDPTKGDTGAALDGLAKNYGDAWPRVFGDLVRAGLPPMTETLGTMDAPSQAGDRQDMQRAINFATQKGGLKALQELTPAATPVMKTAVPDALAAFRQTVMIPGAASNADLLGKVTNAIELKARYNVLQGQDPTAAVNNAYDSIIGKKYDFDGAMRVPKGMLPQVHMAADQALASIKPADLQATANLPPDIGLDRWNSARRSAEWVTTPADDGIMLLTQQRDGTRIRVLRRDGTPIVIPFSQAAKTVALPDFVQPGDAVESGP